MVAPTAKIAMPDMANSKLNTNSKYLINVMPHDTILTTISETSSKLSMNRLTVLGEASNALENATPSTESSREVQHNETLRDKDTNSEQIGRAHV